MSQKRKKSGSCKKRHSSDTSNSKGKNKEFEINNSYPVISDTNHNLSKSLRNRFREAKEKRPGINDFVQDFILNLLSPRTKRSYLKDLDFFFNFLKLGDENITNPSQIQSYHFTVYRDYLVEQGYAPATINRRLVVIRSFMKWALSNKLIDHNPLDSVKLPKTQTMTPTQAFSDEEVRLMLDSPNLKTKEGCCHRIVLILLFHLGLRRSELAELKFKDIKEERNHFAVTIKGKGGKTRLLPLPRVILEELEEYQQRFKVFTKLELEKDDYIIQTLKKGKNHTPCDGSTIYRIVSRYAKRLGINKKVGAHSCRATVISHLLDTKKVMIRDVAEFAGHSQITTTQRYDKKRKGLDDSAAYDVDYEFELKKSS